MFDANSLLWVDFEVRSALDLKTHGTFASAAHPTTRAIVFAYAIGMGPVRVWHADGDILDWEDAPEDLRAAFMNGTMLAAWNATYDSTIWNYATLGFPFLEPERIIDPAIQAGISNLPTDLESASQRLTGEGKQADGKALIRLFCVGGANPDAHPAKWQQFLAYARRDVEAMRDVYRRTRPLPLGEWREYWAFEHVNRRGVTLDMPFVLAAEKLVAEDAIAIGRRVTELTGEAVTKVTQAKRMVAWLFDQLPEAEMRAELVIGGLSDSDDDEEEEEEEDGESGDEEESEDNNGTQKLSLRRTRVERLIARLETKAANNGGLSRAESDALEVATLRLYGAGASPLKFKRLAAQQIDGVLRGQYVFSGGFQTGRLSSKGAQIQNLAREVLGDKGAAEAALVDLIADGCSYADLVAAEPANIVAARKLALLVRPALIAAPGKIFVWSDQASIEARIPPWLALSEDGEQVLDIFRANDADPSQPDRYTLAAADIRHKEPGAVTPDERNIGKVSTLALGFAGSVGALQSMARAYRIHLDDEEARHIVDAWRKANPWVWEFWGIHRAGESYGLWGAALDAIEMPGLITTAGRIRFVYREDYLDGALFMELPSGRLLTYPQPQQREMAVKDKDGEPTGEMRLTWTFRRAHGRVKLWRGTLAENATQGCAADLLRATVKRIETNPALAWMPIHMTTHDEIVCECDESRADEAKAILRREMLTVPEWAAGLPLQSEESVCPYYTKSKAALTGGKT
jgi:DNA polymerase bacteriophage-type